MFAFANILKFEGSDGLENMGMNYRVTVTFDLHDVPKEALEKVYDGVYAGLSEIGLARTAEAYGGEVAPLPESTVMGRFPGESAEKAAEKARSTVKKILKSLNLDYTIFVTFGTGWKWSRTGAIDLSG
jgi:hypothetical protein